MKDVNIDSSRKFQGLLLNIVFASFFLILILSYSFFKFGENSFAYSKNYYAISIEEGKEGGDKIQVIRSPFIDKENIKTWLRYNFIGIFSKTELNYQSDEHWQLVKSVFASGLDRDFWDQEVERFEELIKNGYKISNAVVVQPPVLLGEFKSFDGVNYWKYYLELSTENLSIGQAEPNYQRLKLNVVVKETNPSKNFRGIVVDSITIN
jgi:hypothetical protein